MSRFTFPAFMPADAQYLISKLLRKDPRKRMPLENISKHPFVLLNIGE